jgi:hypothetical protein
MKMALSTTIFGIFLLLCLADAFLQLLPSSPSISPSLYSTTALFKKKQQAKANHDVKWEPFFERLVKHCDLNNGDFNGDTITDESLKEWLVNQQKQYVGLHTGKKVRLTKKRAAALESIGAVLFEEREL